SNSRKRRTGSRQGVRRGQRADPQRRTRHLECEDFWFSFGPTPHLRLVFDNMLKPDWAPAGLACPIPASGISLSPPSQTHPTGSTAKVTAKVVDIEGKSVEKVEVTFEVTGGPNKGTKGTATSNASGEAEFTYTGGSSTGTDEVV